MTAQPEESAMGIQPLSTRAFGGVAALATIFVGVAVSAGMQLVSLLLVFVVICLGDAGGTLQLYRREID